MKLIIALLCLASLSASASTTAVTATLTDGDGSVWANCTWSATLNGVTPPTVGKVAVPDAQTHAGGKCDASGALSATMLNTASVDQAGATWTFTVLPNASVTVPSVISGVTTATGNLTTILSAGLIAPRFQSGPNAFGYADIEVQSASIGSTYSNTGTVCGGPSLRQLSNAGWVCQGGGGGASLPSTVNLFKGNNAGGALAATPAVDYLVPSQLGAASGVAPLDGTSKVPFANLTQPTPAQAITNLGTNRGLSIFGDSICAATGTSTTGVGNVPLQNGYAYLTRSQMGGPYLALCNPGDQVADNSTKFGFKGAYPQGNNTDPIYVDELGTNDATFYAGDANKQLIFQGVYLGNVVSQGVTVANKKFAQTCTLAGGFAADANTPYSGMGIVSTTNGATASCAFTAPQANASAYACYKIQDANGGTFTLAIDGVQQNDPNNGTTTWTAAGANGALIHTNNNINAAFTCARFTGLSAASHTFLFTATSATSPSNSVWIEFVAYAPVANATNNPVVLAVSPNQQNGSVGAPFVATYQGFIQSIVSNVAADGINAFYIDTSNALLNSPLCGNGNAATMFTNCYADMIHPNNLGHSVMSTTILAGVPTARKNASTAYNPSQPLQNLNLGQTYTNGVIPSVTLGPLDFLDVNPANMVGSPTLWAPGIKFSGANGQVEYAAHTTIGLTFGVPSDLYMCTSGSGGVMMGRPPLVTDCNFHYGTNGFVDFFQGNAAATGLRIQGGQMSGGANYTFNVPGKLSLTSSTSGAYSITLPTSVSTNNNSPAIKYFGGAWNDVTHTAAFDGPGWFSAAVNPTPTGQVAQAYLTIQNGTALQAGLDLRPSILINHLGVSDLTTINTITNCSSSASPAVCAAAPSGSVVVAAAATTVVVNTTAVTANSQILLTSDSSLGTKLGVTCNATPTQAWISARTAGTSFTVTVASAPTTNPQCLSYTIIN